MESKALIATLLHQGDGSAIVEAHAPRLALEAGRAAGGHPKSPPAPVSPGQSRTDGPSDGLTDGSADRR